MKVSTALATASIFITTIPALAGNAEKAAGGCKGFKELAELTISQNSHVFLPIAGKTEDVREAEHEVNEAVADMNKMIMENGSSYCKRAGMPWNYNLETSYSRNSRVINTSNVNIIIRQKCEDKWGTDFVMIKYCIEQQSKAARSLGY